MFGAKRKSEEPGAFSTGLLERLPPRNAEQQRLGDELHRRLVRASCENQQVALLVSKIENNAGRFSVSITLGDVNGYVVMQYSVGESKLYAQFRRYGGEVKFSYAEFEEMASRACQRVRTFT